MSWARRIKFGYLYHFPHRSTRRYVREVCWASSYHCCNLFHIPTGQQAYQRLTKLMQARAEQKKERWSANGNVYPSFFIHLPCGLEFGSNLTPANAKMFNKLSVSFERWEQYTGRCRMVQDRQFTCRKHAQASFSLTVLEGWCVKVTIQDSNTRQQQ